jgi:hypothetical protein
MHMKAIGALAAVLLVSVSALPAARAGAPEGTAEAGGFLDAGDRDLAAGRYLDAVSQYQRGYATSNQPRFLLRIAESYKTLGDLPRARDYYRRYLAEAPKDDPDRPRGAEELHALDPPAMKELPKPRTDLDAGRTQAEIRTALGQEDYERYLASGLTFNGFKQREQGNSTAVKGIVTAVTSLAVGAGLVLTAGNAGGGRAVVGYVIAATGGPIGFWIMRVGFTQSTMANYQVRQAAPQTAEAAPSPRALALGLWWRF